MLFSHLKAFIMKQHYEKCVFTGSYKTWLLLTEKRFQLDAPKVLNSKNVFSQVSCTDMSWVSILGLEVGRPHLSSTRRSKTGDGKAAWFNAVCGKVLVENSVCSYHGRCEKTTSESEYK